MTALAPHADALRGTLAEATLGNCIEIARALLELAVQRDLPVPSTHQVVPLNPSDMTPYSRHERQRMRLVLPLRPEVRQRLGIAPDDFVQFPAWPYHVTTEFVPQVLVACLTGEAGAPMQTYLESFFQYSTYLGLVEFDVTQEEEPA